MKFSYADQQIQRPRLERGIDYSAKRLVLARMGQKELQWRKSCRCWRDLLVGYTAEPGELSIMDYGEDREFGNGPVSQELYNEGGRLSKALLAKLAPKIDKFFGGEVTKHLNTRKTLLIEP